MSIGDYSPGDLVDSDKESSAIAWATVPTSRGTMRAEFADAPAAAMAGGAPEVAVRTRGRAR